MTQDEIIEMADKACIYMDSDVDHWYYELTNFAKLVAAKAIAELESQEPVAWMRDDGMKAMTNDEKQAWIQADRGEIVEDYNTPLTHPPQRTWIDLTQQELDELDEQNPSLQDFVQSVMSKLKEKNS